MYCQNQHASCVLPQTNLGKSRTIEKIVEWAENQKLNVAIAAPTGVAAINIGGETLHSVAGCGVPSVVGDLGKMWFHRSKWRSMDLLIIDEVCCTRHEEVAE